MNPAAVSSNLFGAVLLVIGVLGVGAIFFWYWRQGRRRKSPSPPPLLALPAHSPGIWADLFRALLLLLAVAVAAALVVVLLPDRTFEGMTRILHSRHAGGAPERIALLYLGDASDEDTFRIRAVVRNVSPDPIERLDAAVRLYARDGSLRETVIVRMDRESVAPGDVARLELGIPGGRMEIGAYSVEFKLRGGEAVAYRDMRKPAAR